jgi:hypothetical protein
MQIDNRTFLAIIQNEFLEFTTVCDYLGGRRGACGRQWALLELWHGEHVAKAD